MPKPFVQKNQVLGPPSLSHLEGPIDPEIGVIAIRSDEKVQHLLLHDTCHPVVNFGKPEHCYSVSTDWFGAWSERMLSRLGSDSMPLVVNGCCGNINPWHPCDANFDPDNNRMAEALAGMTDKILEHMNYSSEAVVKCPSARFP